MTAASVSAGVAVVVAGLVAGLLFGWQVSVIPGTRRCDDRTYVQTMQRINQAIINPAFVLPFMLAPVLLGLAAALEFRMGNTRRASALAAAAVTYLLGVLGVTIGGNVPLNNDLDRFDLAGATDASISQARARYEPSWNRWHSLRMAASVIAFAVSAASLQTSG